MQVFRDAYGVPHLRAGSLPELAHLQGRTAVVDRGQQLDVERRRSQGTLAELVGPSALPWDRFARRARLDDTARQAFSRLDPETRSWLTAYSDGVRAGGLTWHPWSSIGVFAVQQILFGTFPAKLWRAHVERTLGSAAVDWFAVEGPSGSGSNAWAVPLELAGDPHRALELPGVYQQVRLACPALDVVGLTFPGVPGVQHFGHTGDVAWAVTNAMADYQDLYQEQLTRTPDGGLRARGPHGWEPVRTHTETIAVLGRDDEVIEVTQTARGPVIDGDLSLRTPARVELDLGFAALLPLLRARTVDDVADALEHWVEPVNSVLVADTSGRVLQLSAGRVPLRDERTRRFPVPAWQAEHTWRDGYAPMTRQEVSGSAVHANDRRPDTETLGVDFAPPERGRRIRRLLTEGAVPERIHTDTTMAAGSEAAGRYAAWRSAVAQQLHDHPALAPLLEPVGVDALLAPWTDPHVRIGIALDGVLAGLGLAATDVVDPATVTSGRWGERHVLAPVVLPGLQATVPRTELSGDRASVLRTSDVPGVTDACSTGPVARYVWDLSGRRASRWVVPFGASGDPTSRHFADQLPLWARGELIPIVTDWHLLTEETT